MGDHTVTSNDFVIGDDDGVLFLPMKQAAEVAELAGKIRDTERRQAARMSSGESLRAQMQFPSYLTARDNTGTTFREYLRALGGAIEE